MLRKPLLLLASGLALASAVPAPALAYIGPGAGITMLGALWGVVVALALAFGAVLFWPVRALLRRRKRPAATEAAMPAHDGEGSAATPAPVPGQGR